MAPPIGKYGEQYWAALPDTRKLGDKLAARVQEYDSASLLTSINARTARSYAYYFGLNPAGIHATSQVLREGEQGQLAAVRVNHSRPLLNTLLNLIVGPKVVWQPKAVNIDYQSLRETELAAAVLEYYWAERQVSKLAVQALEEALAFTEGFILCLWDPNGGEEYAADPDTGSIIKTGDICYKKISTWDVLRDPTKTSWDELDWVIVRQWRNKWDLMAEYPDFTDQIYDAPRETTNLRNQPLPRDLDNEDIPVYSFFHKRRPAIPEGRETVFLTSGIVLADGPLSYSDIPLHRVSAGEMTGTPYGYSPFLDILGIQEVMDSLHTIVSSNQSTFGGQVIAAPDGSNVVLDSLAGGMTVVYYPAGEKPPQPLQLVSTPGEIFTYLRDLKSAQELVFGLNSVVRGEPQSGEQSGSALALLQQQALQQSSTIQTNWTRMVEAIGQATIEIIQKRADVPMKIAIVGKAEASYVMDQEFTGTQDLTNIKRVHVEIGNPLSQTTAGRKEIAQELMQAGQITSPEQYIELIRTGRLEPLTKSLQGQLMLITNENEQLQAAAYDQTVPAQPKVDPVTGQLMPPEPQLTQESMPPVLVTDDHRLHVREHRTVLDAPNARRNPAVVRATLKHIDEHEKAYYSTPPQILQMYGQQIPDMPAPAGMVPTSNGPPVPAPKGLPPGGLPKPPQNPVNPATGQRWQPNTPTKPQ